MANGTGQPVVQMTDEQLKKLLRSNQSLATPSSAGAPSFSSFNKATAEAAGKTDVLAMALGAAGKAGGVAKDGFDKLKDGIEQNLDVFRDLSKTGASFSNDVVGMTVAAAGSRMSLAEFSEVIKSGATNFAGLGGNVVRGAEAFANLSKEMFDSRLTDSLKQLGYTNKELNEVLALQVGFSRSSLRDDEASRKRAIQSATELATEMDLMAKLTGKTREEQMEASKKAQSDMAVEAKMRLIGIKEGPEAEARARENFAKQYNEAQLRGQGQMFKEVFATGNVMSKEAGLQTALQGKAALATIEQARALSAGNIERANAASVRAQEETMRNQRNVGQLMLATTGPVGGPAAMAVQENMAANRTMYDGVQKQIQNGAKGVADALVAAKNDIVQAQSGQRKDDKGQYQEVDGATRAVIQLGNRAGDVQAALAKQLIEPLNTRVGPALGRFADQYLSGVITTRDKEGRVTGQQNFTQAIEAQLGAGFKEGSGQTPTPSTRPSWMERAGEKEPFVGADALKSIGQITGNVAKITADKIDSLVIGGQPVRTRQTGSLGETGNLLENFGSGTMAVLHGREAVLTEDQLKNLALGSKNQGIETMVNTVKNSIPKTSVTGSQSSINLTDVARSISTSISSSITGGETTTRRVQNDDSKAAEEEMQSLKKKFESDWAARKEILVQGMAVEDRKFSKVQAAMKADEDAIKLKEDYAKKQEELQKRIDAGISIEVERKNEALAESQKIATEEVNLKNIIGKSVKGMSDDAIEAMLPMGSKMEDFYVDIGGKLQSFSNDTVKKVSSNIDNASASTAPKVSNVPTKATGPGGEYTHEEARIEAARLNTLSLEKFNRDADLALGVKTPKSPMAGVKDLVSSTMPTSKIDIGNIEFDPMTGLPNFKQLRAQTASLPGGVRQEQRRTEAERTTTAPKPAPKAEPKADPRAPSPTSKDATINDVVRELTTLNKLMGSLLAQSEDLGNKQVRAVRSTGSNLYAR